MLLSSHLYEQHSIQNCKKKVENNVIMAMILFFFPDSKIILCLKSLISYAGGNFSGENHTH